MQIDILTLFPEMFSGPLSQSLLKKARDKGLIKVRVHDIREHSLGKHKTVDDASYGGGPGMVMKADVVAKAIESIGPSKKQKVIFMCPTGKRLSQEKIKALSKQEHLIILCGHYEGVDQRAVDHLIDEEISIGDYVLTGGELPAMVLIDAVARLLPGVVKEKDSVTADSFYQGLLDHPHYTRPEKFNTQKVPQELLSGDHKKIAKWRRKQAVKRTFFKRPDLLAGGLSSKEDRLFLEEVLSEK